MAKERSWRSCHYDVGDGFCWRRGSEKLGATPLLQETQTPPQATNRNTVLRQRPQVWGNQGIDSTSRYGYSSIKAIYLTPICFQYARDFPLLPSNLSICPDHRDWMIGPYRQDNAAAFETSGLASDTTRYLVR